MIVIYAEKHSLAKTIASALGAGERIPCKAEPTIAHWEFDINGEAAVICHGAGHLAGLVSAKEYGESYAKWDINAYPCIPEGFKLESRKNCSTLIDYVSSYLKKADTIINATDPDREGELIFAYLLDIVFEGKTAPPWKRVLIEDYTDETICKAFSNLKTSAEMIPLQMAGRARDIADWLIGCNLTIAMTKKFGSKDNLLSVGRVQTPTLALVAKREKEVKEHIKTPFWRVIGCFKTADVTADVKFTAEHIAEKLEVKSEAEAIVESCRGKKAIVIKKTIKQKSEATPLLYNATALMASVGNKLGWELDKTAKVMQTLYENKLMSYPRTSSEHLTEQMTDEAAITIERLMKLDELKQFARPRSEWAEFTKRHFDSSKVGSHTAIIPTKAVPANLSSLSDDEQQLYIMIAKSLIRTVYPKATFEETELEIGIDEQRFKCKGSIPLERGWRSLEAEKEKLNILPAVSEGDELENTVNIEEGETEPPKRYTESSLVLTMEVAGQKLEDKEAVALMKAQKKGLGTDATRQAIIKGLFDKGFLQKKGKSILPTEKGTFLIDTLAVNELKSAELTGEWEKRLNDITTSENNAEALYTSFVSDIKKALTEWYDIIKNSNGQQYFSANEAKMICPFCGRRMFKGKFGYSCTGYTEDCKFSINYEICGKKITEAQAAMLVSSGKTALIKGFTGKSGKAFDARLKLDKQQKKIAFEFINKG